MKYQDIQVNDIALQSQFAAYWMQGNYTEALNLLENNGQLNSKAFIAEVMLKIGESLSIIENYYVEDFENALSMDLTLFNESINEFRNRKQWDSTTAYKIGNAVEYDNTAYVCIQNNTNQLPTNTNYWAELIGLQGDKGIPGIDVNYRGQWLSSQTYNKNDIAIYGDYLWVSLQDNVTAMPSTTSDKWGIFLPFPKVKIFVSRKRPENIYNGLIWARILLPYTFEEVNALNYTFADVNALNINWDYANGGGW